MTINWIIEMLKLSGINSKQIIITALSEATDLELVELKNSINELINIKRS